MGLAAVCKNHDFSRDSGGPTQAVCRAGINTSMQCLDPAAPVTGAIGFVYSPESATDPAFQLPMAFQPTEGSQYENPVGSGVMNKFPQTNFTEPQGAHAIQASAGNKVFSAYSDLKVPLSALSNMDPKAKTMNPFGMKPFGFNWLPGTPVLAGEVCTPASPLTGNGHTYQAQNSGTTAALAANQPVWPLTEGGEVIDNGITWKEKTMVIANRLPPPPVPTLALAGAGTILAFKDVYVVITLQNTAGETLPSVPVHIETLVSSSTVTVQVPLLSALPGWIQGLSGTYIPLTAKIYVAIVGHGSEAPALSSYQLYGGVVALGSTTNVTAAGTGVAPPTVTTARVTPGQLPTPTTEPQIQRVPAGSTVAPPAAPVLTLVNSGGSFSSNTTVQVALTLTNASGETTIGAASAIITTAGSQGVEVTLATNYGPTVTGVNIYVFNSGVWKLVDNAAVGGSYIITAFPGAASNPPVTNTATLPVGSFPGGRDVYVAMTYKNAIGETPLGPANTIINTNPDDSIFVTVAVPLGPGNVQLYAISAVGIYEADVPTGTPAPPASAFSLIGYYQQNATPFILETATGANPPIVNGTGPGGAIVADTSTGGANGGQGYRYATMGWINQMETFSGFTLASVVSTIIDEDGWEIGVFNVLIGPENIIGRYIPFAVADSSQEGPFNWIGLVDILVPSQNIVYPTRTLVDSVEQSATVFLDNTTTQGIFNFTDEYLVATNNVDDRLDVTIPPQGVRVDYLESVGRLAITGVPGLESGTWISLASDYESFYGDTSQVPVASAGDQCYGVTDQYKGIPIAMMKSGGFTLGANTGDPASWAATRRWGGTDPGKALGPCGFRAWDASGKFIIFAHRSGIYKYDESDPDLMSKEVPRQWARINWAYGHLICVRIDEDTHTVRILVPTGASTVPNEEFCLSYIEGWNNPIHFSTFSGKEISMDAARRWSFNDVSAFMCLRMERTLPPGGNAFLDGPTFNVLQDSSFQLTQLLYPSSGPDGTIQARTPGVFSDNGSGIDQQYETMSTGMMQAPCKPEGFNLNACGYGLMFPSFIASREMVDDQGGENQLIQVLDELQMDPIALSPKQVVGITRKCVPSINEFWRMRFTNGKQPGSWFSLKAATVYVIPWTGGRDIGDK